MGWLCVVVLAWLASYWVRGLVLLLCQYPIVLNLGNIVVFLFRKNKRHNHSTCWRFKNSSVAKVAVLFLSHRWTSVSVRDYYICIRNWVSGFSTLGYFAGGVVGLVFAILLLWINPHCFVKYSYHRHSSSCSICPLDIEFHYLSVLFPVAHVNYWYVFHKNKTPTQLRHKLCTTMTVHIMYTVRKVLDQTR